MLKCLWRDVRDVMEVIMHSSNESRIIMLTIFQHKSINLLKKFENKLLSLLLSNVPSWTGNLSDSIFYLNLKYQCLNGLIGWPVLRKRQTLFLKHYILPEVKIGFLPHRSMTKVQKTNDGISISDVRMEERNWKSDEDQFNKMINWFRPFQ